MLILIDASEAEPMDTQDSQTPLEVSASNKLDPDTWKFANVNKLDECGFSPLHYAAASGKDVENLLGSGANVELCDKLSNTALHWAMLGGCVSAISALVQHGANINKQNNDGETPLHFAAGITSPASADCVQYLLQAGADPNIASTNGHTPLHYAACSGNVGVVRKLIEGGAHPNCEDTEGETPLHVAASELNGRGVIRALLAAGANINARNSDGEVCCNICTAC